LLLRNGRRRRQEQLQEIGPEQFSSADALKADALKNGIFFLT
jgi:hypothetical protein